LIGVIPKISLHKCQKREIIPKLGLSVTGSDTTTREISLQTTSNCNDFYNKVAKDKSQHLMILFALVEHYFLETSTIIRLKTSFLTNSQNIASSFKPTIFYDRVLSIQTVTRHLPFVQSTSLSAATNMKNIRTASGTNDATPHDFTLTGAFISSNSSSSSIVSYPLIPHPRSSMSLRNVLDIVSQALEIVEDYNHMRYNGNKSTNCECLSPRGTHTSNGRDHDGTPNWRDEDRPGS
jgi:hypothetical protein